MTAKFKTDFDPVTLEILWSRLISIADESAAALLRTAFSTLVRESNDFATVLMDADCNCLAENTGGIPSFVGMLPGAVRDFIDRIPLEEWR
ncbi:MAG TPA: 5-oxoprolinase, partial [Gammaproteobacteria bacterium]|nr:5-oxoprolinase [Gammaproteobacteria bacterium]